MYADNAVMYFTASNTKEISGSTLTSELAEVNDRLVDNSLFIPQGKTKCVLLGTGSRLATVNFSVNIDGKEPPRLLSISEKMKPWSRLAHSCQSSSLVSVA